VILFSCLKYFIRKCCKIELMTVRTIFSVIIVESSCLLKDLVQVKSCQVIDCLFLSYRISRCQVNNYILIIGWRSKSICLYKLEDYRCLVSSWVNIASSCLHFIEKVHSIFHVIAFLYNCKKSSIFILIDNAVFFLRYIFSLLIRYAMHRMSFC